MNPADLLAVPFSRTVEVHAFQLGLAVGLLVVVFRRRRPVLSALLVAASLGVALGLAPAVPEPVRVRPWHFLAPLAAVPALAVVLSSTAARAE